VLKRQLHKLNTLVAASLSKINVSLGICISVGENLPNRGPRRVGTRTDDVSFPVELEISRSKVLYDPAFCRRLPRAALNRASTPKVDGTDRRDGDNQRKSWVLKISHTLEIELKSFIFGLGLRKCDMSHSMGPTLSSIPGRYFGLARAVGSVYSIYYLLDFISSSLSI
jgi:hypothetical protein